MAIGQDIRITDVPFSSVPDTSATVFINDKGKLRQTDLTTIAKYSELYTLILGAHEDAMTEIQTQFDQNTETFQTQFEQSTASLQTQFNESTQALQTTEDQLVANLNALHNELKSDLNTSHTNQMGEMQQLIDDGHEKLLKDTATVDDLRINVQGIGTTTANPILNTYEGVLKIVYIRGNYTQHGTPVPDAPVAIRNTGDFVEMISGYYNDDGEYTATTSESICCKYGIPGTEGDILTLTLPGVVNARFKFYNDELLIGSHDPGTASIHNVEIPSGANKVKFHITDPGYVPTESDKIILTINNKYILPIKTYDDNGNDHTEYIYLDEPLRKVGNVADRIIEQNGVFGVERNVKEVVFNGSEAWSQANKVGDWLQIMLAMDNNPIVTSECLSDLFSYEAYTNVYSNKMTAITCDANSNIRLSMSDTNVTSLDLFKTWLAENPTTVDYILATPTFTPLDTESQKALNRLKTFDTVTYIEVDSVVQPSGMEFEYGLTKVGAQALLNECNQKLSDLEHDEDIEELSKGLEDCFQSVSDGKAKVASAIAGKGIPTESDATFDTMAENIGKLASGIKVINVGNTTGSIDVKTICNNNGIDYKKLTASNFAIYAISGGQIETDKIGGSAVYFTSARLQSTSISLGYNASNGVVSVSGNSEKIWVRDPTTNYNIYSASRALTCAIRLIYLA